MIDLIWTMAMACGLVWAIFHLEGNWAEEENDMWKKSSRSEPYPEKSPDQCVEVSVGEDAVAVRDSKNPGSGHLLFPRDTWGEFVAAVKGGELHS